MRQIIYILFFILALLLSPLQAESAQQTNSVKELIEKVKRSSGDERRKAMNALKLKLRTVSQESRTEAMRELRKSFASGTYDKGMSHSGQSSSHQQIQQRMSAQHQRNIQMQMKPGGGMPTHQRNGSAMPRYRVPGGGHP